MTTDNPKAPDEAQAAQSLAASVLLSDLQAAYFKAQHEFLSVKADLRSSPDDYWAAATKRNDAWYALAKYDRDAHSSNGGTQRPGDADATNAMRATPPGSLE